jgi:transcriptional regulator with XRE-family HTH domain
MPADPEVVQRARTLRGAGLSTPQVAAELGGLPLSTVKAWLTGVPVPEWTRRPQAKDEDREAARDLRREGLTYGEIAARLHVSKSSVSLWVRDLPHPPRRPGGEARRRQAHSRYYADLRESKEIRRGHEVDAVATVVGPPSLRELLIAGAVAYWAEGSKRKPWRPAERVTFINSDPDMVRLFLAFLAAMGVSDDRRTFRVAIHESADEAAARGYWSEVIAVPAVEFQRTTLKRHTPRTVRKNVGDDYHGCLVVGVRRSIGLYREIEGIWRAISRGASTL